MEKQGKYVKEDESTISLFRRNNKKKTPQACNALTNPHAPYRNYKLHLDTQSKVYNSIIDQYNCPINYSPHSYYNYEENLVEKKPKVQSRYMDFYYKDLQEREQSAPCECCSHLSHSIMMAQNWSLCESTPMPLSYCEDQSPIQQTIMKRKRNDTKSRYMDFLKTKNEPMEDVRTKIQSPQQSYFESFNTIAVYKSKKDKYNSSKEIDNACYVINPRPPTQYYDDPDRRSRLFKYIMDEDYPMKQLLTHIEEEEDLQEHSSMKPRNMEFNHQSRHEKKEFAKSVSPSHSCGEGEFKKPSVKPRHTDFNHQCQDEENELTMCVSPTNSCVDIDLEEKPWKNIRTKSRYMDFYNKNRNQRKDSAAGEYSLDAPDLNPTHCPHEATETVLSDQCPASKTNDTKTIVIKSRYVDWEKDRPSDVFKNASQLDWNDYHRLNTIHNFLDDMQNNYPSICTTGVIGSSIENRDLTVLKVSNSNVGNARVWIDAGIHAREWIAPAVNTYIINYIVKNFDELPDSITNKDWYFLPVMNPDGYEFSHTNSRMWRKNKAWHGRECLGVDLNRNFSFGWGCKGSSNDPKSPFYHGPHPFSEPESRAVRDMLQSSGIKFKVYITLHSFGEVILFPFAYRDELCPDYVRLLEGATVMSKAIYAASGNIYKVGISRDVMYGAAGTSCDWSYGEAKIPFCYLLELRSKKHKFRLPQIEIEETGKEILSAIMALMKFVDNYDLDGNFIEDPKMSINIWKEERSTMDFFVDKPRVAQVASMLHERGIPFSVSIRDVDELRCCEQGSSITVNLSTTERPGCPRASPTRTGRFLLAIYTLEHNKGVWLDGGIHAREWVSIAVTTYIANEIVQNFNRMPESVTNKDWYILAVVNPDGYVYTHTTDRMWRKNRAQYGQCAGVDLNRNFSIGWGQAGEDGSSEDPGSIFYRGPKPFSEPETAAIKKVIHECKADFKAFLSLHSYGEVILFPWGYTSDPCPSYVELLEGGTVMARAIHAVNGRTYKVGSTKDIMYYSAGTSVDWSYGCAKIPYSYMIELPSKQHRFLLPKDRIIPTAKEVFCGVIELMQFIDRKCKGMAQSATSCRANTSGPPKPSCFKPTSSSTKLSCIKPISCSPKPSFNGLTCRSPKPSCKKPISCSPTSSFTGLTSSSPKPSCKKPISCSPTPSFTGLTSSSSKPSCKKPISCSPTPSFTGLTSSSPKPSCKKPISCSPTPSFTGLTSCSPIPSCIRHTLSCTPNPSCIIRPTSCSPKPSCIRPNTSCRPNSSCNL
ncbi:uncharacterized protein LOC134797337 [Cydia splendana]|uniref:uncharacterized protein LOC134797337 n=1 Tax=Cydia splendana TaxID=1100963 RepID=UPI00300C39C7